MSVAVTPPNDLPIASGRPSRSPGKSSPGQAHVPPVAEGGRVLCKRHPKKRLNRLAALLFVGDWFVACTAVFCGLAIRVLQRGDWGAFYHNLTGEFFPAGAWVAAGGTMFCGFLAVFRTYDPRNLYRMHFLVRNLAKSVLLWPLVALAVIGLARFNALAPRLGLVYAVAMLAVFMGIWRVLALKVLMHPRIRRATRERVLVVGWNERADEMRKAMLSDFGQLREVIGCVPAPGGSFRRRPPADVQVLGDFPDLPQLIGPNHLDAVILADVATPAPEIRRLIAFCQREYLGFHLVPEYFPVLESRLRVEAVSGVPLLGISDLPLDSAFNRIAKRTFDIVGAAIGMALAAPVIALFAGLVHLESPGPVIYRQVRTTREGRRFQILKIRSMALDAEAATGAVWSRRADPRCLRIGAFMRKWNIDELPQFWNVLKGDMSLVGPRPERPELIEGFKDTIPNYNVRHTVRAGVTGWAAIHGLRGDTDLSKRVEHDIDYVENWSLLLDLYCIVATFIKNENAH